MDAEVARWGGAQAFTVIGAAIVNCARVFALQHYRTADLAEDDRRSGGAVIWWSNAFCTIYSATHYVWNRNSRSTNTGPPVWQTEHPISSCMRSEQQ